MGLFVYYNGYWQVVNWQNVGNQIFSFFKEFFPSLGGVDGSSLFYFDENGLPQSSSLTLGSNTKSIYIDDGTLKASQYTLTTLETKQTITGEKTFNNKLLVKPTESNYQEGIRIDPAGSWSMILLKGSDLQADQGTSAKSWLIANNDGTLYFNLNGSDSAAGNKPRVKATSTGWAFGNVDPYNNYALSSKGIRCAEGDMFVDNGRMFICKNISGIDDPAGAELNFQIKRNDINVTSGGYIACYDDYDDANYGTVMVINSGGNTFIGGGESARNVYNSDNKYQGAHENLFLTSDSYIEFITNCNTIANKKMILNMVGSTITVGSNVTLNVEGTAASRALTLSQGVQFVRPTVTTNWVKGREGAIIRTNTCADGNYSPVISVKTLAGSWQIGSYASGNNDNAKNALRFTYTTDANYNSSSNTAENSFYVDADGTVHGRNLAAASALTAASATISGNATISGSLTLGSLASGLMVNNNDVTIKMTGVTRGSNPSANQYKRFSFVDTAGTALGYYELGVVTGNQSRLNMWLLNHATGTAYGGIYLFNTRGTTTSKQASYNTNTGEFVATTVKGAVWNDYAEYRETKEKLEPGRCIKETGKGDLVLTTKRMEEGCEIISDTFGFAIGETEKCKTPTAVAGRVLAHLYESNKQARIGQPVCSGPNGTVSLMTNEEARNYPWCIIGTISEIPDYEEWFCGGGPGDSDPPEPIKVNGRVWIRMR